MICNDTADSGRTPIDSDLSISQDVATLELVPRVPANPAEALPDDESEQDYEVVVRYEVARIMDAFVDKQHSMRAASGSIAINLDRLKLHGAKAKCVACRKGCKEGKHRGDGSHEFVTATMLPDAPTVTNDKGEPLPPTASRRDMVRLMRAAGAQHQYLVFHSVRDWRGTIGWVLKRVGYPYANLLERAAEIRRIERPPFANRVVQIEAMLASETQRRQYGRKACAKLHAELASKRRMVGRLTVRHEAITRRSEYKQGVLLFAIRMVSLPPDDQRYISRDRGTLREMFS